MTTKDQVAQLIVTEAKTRGHSRDECLAEMSCLYQESEWDETVWDATHTTYGIAQQDASYPNRSKGAAAQIAAFFDRLDKKRASPGCSGPPTRPPTSRTRRDGRLTMTRSGSTSPGPPPSTTGAP